MPRTNINYDNTVIYKIVCNDLNIKELYVGHTTDFKGRKSTHKAMCNNPIYNYKIYKIIRENKGWDNWTMIEIEKFQCVDGNEARKRERYWFELLSATLNPVVPSRTKTEYREENPDKSKEYYRLNKDKYKQYREENKERRTTYRNENKERMKQHRIDNKDKIKETRKIYREQKFICECGGKYTIDCKRSHFRTIKHCKFIETKN